MTTFYVFCDIILLIFPLRLNTNYIDLYKLPTVFFFHQNINIFRYNSSYKPHQSDRLSCFIESITLLIHLDIQHIPYNLNSFSLHFFLDLSKIQNENQIIDDDDDRRNIFKLIYLQAEKVKKEKKKKIKNIFPTFFFCLIVTNSNGFMRRTCDLCRVDNGLEYLFASV